MKKFLLPEGGQFYKANLHCHTTCSDGRLTPQEAKDLYQSRGYSILAFTDHSRLIPHTELKDEAFLPITAVEIGIADPKIENKFKPCYHLNFYSKKEEADFIPLRTSIKMNYGVDTVNAYIADANKRGFLAQYNHPRWSCQTFEDYGPLKGLWGFEVFNSSAQQARRNGWGDEEFQQMCRAGTYLCPTAGDDNHNRIPLDHYRNDCFGGWTMIKAPALEYDAVLGAMEKGDLYASTGPEIYELYAEEGNIHIKTSPANLILLRTAYNHYTAVHAPEDTLTEAVLDPAATRIDPTFIRIEVWSKEGRAMTRPYLPEEWRD